MKHGLLLLVAAGLVIGIFFVDPIAQDPAYHQFADARRLVGIPNFWNVTSNLLFLIVGVLGIRYLSGADLPGVLPGLMPAYRVFFVGILLTAFGSAWYHLGPGNDSLVWDRLPMTLAFMALFSIVLGEHVSEALGRHMLLPLLAAGAGSVFFWFVSESHGQGDLRPYALIQFLPMILIPLVLQLYPSRFDRTGFIWGMIVVYAAAKLFEYADYNVFRAALLISGHSLKHLIAAAAPLLFLRGLQTRRLSRPPVTNGFGEKDH